MIEQNGNALNFYAFFVQDKVGTSDLTVTVDIYDGTTDLVKTGATDVTEIGGGLYKYTLSSSDNTSEGELIAVFKTSTTDVDQQHIPAIWVIDKAGVENLDAAISGVSTLSATDIISDGTAFQGAYIDAAISSRVTLGSGSVSWVITINVDGSPKDGVDVWITTDEAGANVIARGDTDDSGQVTFLLDTGSYYAWKQLAGYSFTNPEAFTVTST
jgi:hypothetical protein